MIGSKCAILVLRNWRYVTGLYQDSPFYESVAPTDVLRHVGCWCAVVSLGGDVVDISFGLWVVGSHCGRHVCTIQLTSSVYHHNSAELVLQGNRGCIF